jgi:hypothetical protein
MEAKKFLQSFFWFAFAAFLAASIPHVAYFFRAYEPNDIGLNWWYWSVSTFIAISIDVTVFLLSLTVASLQRQKKSRSLILSVWLFIIALAGLSWYMNNQYALHFADTAMLAATSVSIPFTAVRIPDINPLIASCFQVLAIAYTWISDKIASDETPKTAAELAAEANELEEVAVQRQRIAAIKREKNITGATGLIDAGASILGHIKGTVKKQSSPIEETQLTSPVAQSTDTVEENQKPQKNDSLATERDTDQLQKVLQNSDEIGTENRSQSSLLDGLASRSSVPIEEAAKIIGCEVKYVRTLRNRGKLKATSRNNELLTIASIKSYIEGKRKGKQETQNSDEPMQLHAVQ